MDTPQYNSFLDRLQYFIKEEGLSLNKFGEMVGFANGGINRVLREKANFGVDKLLSIMEQFPSLNPAWLLRGAGSMLLSGEEAERREKSELDIYSLLETGYAMSREELIQLLIKTARERDDLRDQVMDLSAKVAQVYEQQQKITDLLSRSTHGGDKE